MEIYASIMVPSTSQHVILRFKRYVESWSHDGIVALWPGRIVALEVGAIMEDKSETDRLVAVPGMNAICKHLATDVEVHFKSLVTPPRRAQDRWQLTSDDGTRRALQEDDHAI